MSLLGSVTDIKSKSENFDWSSHSGYLQMKRFRPIFDREFGQLLSKLMVEPYYRNKALRQEYLNIFHQWLTASTLNNIGGLERFPIRDFIVGVTHSLDDLHVRFGPRLVVFEHEYAYHRRILPRIKVRDLKTLSKEDILVISAPFPFFGDLHPQMNDILKRCLDLEIPVHVDSAWYGCMRNFEFEYDHPAIQSVSFSLSKGLGLGSHRAGVRYSREAQGGPVTVINDFNMCLDSLMWIGIKFMETFGSDYAQKKYQAAYEETCSKLNLAPSKALHIAFVTSLDGTKAPVGVRPFLRFLADDINEFTQ